jgi:L,D-transpeptidase ErfK/SrfK
MRLAITPGAYLIHGTNNPLAVGMAVTHGCMRMYPEDIEALFPLVPVGTKVRIINEPVKTAFVNGELLVEVHPPVDAEGQAYEPNLEVFEQLLDKALGSTVAAIHWDFARQALQKADGMPVVVGLEADLDTPLVQTAGSAQPETGATSASASDTPAPPAATPDAAAPIATAPTAAAPVAAADANITPAAQPAPVAPAPEPVAQPFQPAASAEPRPLPPADSSTPPPSGGARSFPAEQGATASTRPSP